MACRAYAVKIIRLCLKGMTDPRAAFGALRVEPSPIPGLLAVLIRFVLTSLTTVLALRQLNAQPFYPPSIAIADPARYYDAQVYFLPVFGIAIWQLMSAMIATLLALGGTKVDFSKVLNLVGVGMLIPMPVVWIWDWAMIAMGSYTMLVMAVSHTLFQLWETWLQAIGLRVVAGTTLPVACALALAANVVFILIAMIVVR
jgi:hypothetical protein